MKYISEIFLNELKDSTIFNASEVIPIDFNVYGNFMFGIYKAFSNSNTFFDLNAQTNPTKGGTGILYTGPVKFVTTNMSIDGNLNITGNIYSYSDKTIKDNIIKLENCLNKLNNITGYSFTRKDLENGSTVHIGLLAQEVEEMFPEIVNNTNTIKSINYNSMIAVIIESIKELKKEINQLTLKYKTFVQFYLHGSLNKQENTTTTTTMKLQSLINVFNKLNLTLDKEPRSSYDYGLTFIAKQMNHNNNLI
jgi:hypothetical protein